MTTNVWQTERLVLAPVSSTERSELHALFTDAAVRRYLMDNNVVDIGWVDDVVAASERQFAETGYGLWAVREVGRLPIVGVCGYVVLNGLQLLYALLPAYWGRGYATEAARAVVERGFAAGLTEIVAAADAPNVASFGVMARLGMTYWKTENGLPYYRLVQKQTQP